MRPPRNTAATIKIDDHIPPPRTLKEVFAALEPGQSFALPRADAHLMRVSASNFGKTLGRQFVVRTNVTETRCWRVDGIDRTKGAQ